MHKNDYHSNGFLFFFHIRNETISSCLADNVYSIASSIVAIDFINLAEFHLFKETANVIAPRSASFFSFSSIFSTVVIDDQIFMLERLPDNSIIERSIFVKKL